MNWGAASPSRALGRPRALDAGARFPRARLAPRTTRADAGTIPGSSSLDTAGRRAYTSGPAPPSSSSRSPRGAASGAAASRSAGSRSGPAVMAGGRWTRRSTDPCLASSDSDCDEEARASCPPTPGTTARRARRQYTRGRPPCAESPRAEAEVPRAKRQMGSWPRAAWPRPRAQTRRRGGRRRGCHPRCGGGSEEVRLNRGLPRPPVLDI